MAVSALLGRYAIGAAAFLFGLIFAAAAQAVPVYTYTFTQGGYLTGDPAYPLPGTLTGSFSGTLDATGRITRSTLTAYHFEIGSADPYVSSWSHDTPPAFFSYNPGDTGSFALIDAGPHLGLGLSACIGVPSALVCGGGTARGIIVLTYGSSPLNSPIFGWDAKTDALPVLTGSVSDVGNPVYVSATPIPAPLALFATGLGALSLLTMLRRRRDRAISVA